MTIIVIILFSFLLHCPVVSSQDQKSIRQTSLDAFNRGQFENAYEGFRQMLLVYPKDPVYKYYTGACLVEMRKDAIEAESLLNSALASGSLRSLPQNALFYLARAQQMKGDFSNAEKNFKRFENEAGKKKAKELNVDEFIAQCRTGTGKAEPLPVVAEPSSPIEMKAVTETKPVTEIAVTRPVEEPDTKTVNESSPINTREREYLSSELDSELGNILLGQDKAEASNIEKSIPDEKVPDKILKDTLTTNAGTEKNTVPRLPETVSKAGESKIAAATTANQAKQKGIFSAFEIVEKVEDKPISINPEIPEGLVYRVQVAVFRNPVTTLYFKGINPIEGFRAAGSSVTTYYAGLFRKNEDVRKALASIRNLGFKDSFVTSQLNGKVVSAERAAILEKEWGSRPLFTLAAPASSNELDTVPPTLHFRVEVARTVKPYNKEETESMRKAAGNLGLDIRQLESGNIVYLIGNFITFESAEDYADLLKKNGYREARVVAWLGVKEIDIATARELFDNLQ